MAVVAPFRGLRYNPARVPELSKVVIPPYDVISPSEQELFLGTSPYNMVRLELGKAEPDDSERNNAHTRAAGFLREWVSNGVLIREDKPAIYYYELNYPLSPRQRLTRNGFICIMRLEEFSSGHVRPHEKTFKAIKNERLGLMLACHANFSSIFGLYSDPAQTVDRLLRAAREPVAAMSFRDRTDMEHRIWRITDPDVHRQVRDLLQDKAVFIADGHHRYETALNYRRLQRERHVNSSRCAPFEYVMMYLSNLDQEGLTILPTHRLLRNVQLPDPDSFAAQARQYFDLECFDADASGAEQLKAQLEARWKNKETAIGFYRKNAKSFCLLTGKKDRISSCLADRNIPGQLRDLDVVVLDHVVLRNVLALSDRFLGDEGNIHFRHDPGDTIAAVRTEDYEAGFLLNPTRIEQVEAVASARLTMPHKSTYFYPKVGSGMVIHPLQHDEEAVW